MKISLLVFIACFLIAPAAAIGQELTPVPSAHDSVSITYSAIRANRVGIGLDQSFEREPLRIRDDSTSGSRHVGTHVKHAVVGGLIGTLLGVAIGAGAGAMIDAHDTSGDNMFPASVFLGVGGGIAGLSIGLLVGALRPVR